jgi:hypothetical protein
MPTNKLEHNPHVAGLYRAIALRFYCRYVDMRDSAAYYGADLADHGKLPTAREASDQYVAAVEEWVWEAPDTADAALALVDFAGIITADRSLGEVLRDQMLFGERDAFYQTLAIANVAAWINKLAMNDLVERERAKLRKGDAA